MLLESLFVLIFNILIVRAVGQAMWSYIYKVAKPSLDNNLKIKKLVVAAFVFLASFIEVQIYAGTQEPNYLQLYKLQRNFNSTELKSSYRQIILNHHPDKNFEVTSERFEFLRQINDVLLKEDVYELYDRYGSYPQSVKELERESMLGQLWNQYFMSFVLFYMIASLMTLIQTYHRDLRHARTISLICLMISAYIEQYYMTEKIPSQVDYVFSNFMVFQIIFIQRMVLTMLIVGFIFYERCLVRGLEWVNQTLQFCRGHFGETQQTLKFLNEVVVQLEKIEEQQNIQLKASESTLQRVMNILVMLAMIVFVGFQFFFQQQK